MKFPAPGRLIRCGLGAFAIVLLVVATRSLVPFIPATAARVQGLGALAPVAFILLYIVAEVAFVPGTLLTVAAGAIFGLLWGTVFAMVGAMLGASAAFLMARYALRRFVERRVSASPRLAALDGALASEGRKIVFLARLAPIIPFNALNYAFGVTRISLVDYLVGSLGIFPGTLLRTYYGHMVGDVARLAAGASPPRTAAHYVLLAIGLIATIGMTVVLARIAGPVLAASTAASPGGTPSSTGATGP
jgi:uncharacterized membrane protein YdjX (TVP38/TMEM64 family)